MRRGEVRWYRFKNPDKKRPVVILTRNSAIEYLGEVTVAPITSTIRDIPSEVLLSREDGMKHDCAINLDHIQTVSKGKIGALIIELTSTKLIQLQQALNFALGFSEEMESDQSTMPKL
jgi:mRNA interferase MazF